VTGWLLDTNVISEPRRPAPNAGVARFFENHPIEQLYVSEITFAEIRFGIERLPDPRRRTEITEWLDHELRPMFDGRTLPVSEDVILRWRLLVEDGRKERYTYQEPDAFLAATALHHGLTLVTRNTRDFERAKVPLLDPWGA
jgi:toxin FitB